MAGGHGGARPGAGRKPRMLVAQSNAMTQDAKMREEAGFTATSHVTATSGKFSDAKVKDAYVNYGHNLGVGANNILSSSTSSFAPLTRIRVLLEWMYRGQFVCANAVDVPAEDMTRQGVSIKGEMDPADISEIEKEITRLAVWDKVQEAIKWSRLYGGCLLWILVDGQDPKTELRLETVGPDQFRGLMVLDRWMVEPSLERLVSDMKSPALGLPMYYRVTADAPALPRAMIHHSRIIRLIGKKLPYWQSLQENLWGESVLETIQDRIQSFDLGSTGAAQLIDKSFIRTFKIKGLRSMIGSNDPAFQGLTQYVNAMRMYQGIEGITLMDADDEYEGNEHGAFSGLSDIIGEFRQQLSGALQIPQTKLFGTSPAGMNATGESDIRNYYDMIKARQISDLLVGATAIYRLTAQSLSIKTSDDFGIEFKPLWQPTEVEKSDIASKITETVCKAEEQGLISPQTALKELKQQSIATGVFTNISQEDIESAVDEPQEPPAPGGIGPDGQPLEPGSEGAGGEEGPPAPKPGVPPDKTVEPQSKGAPPFGKSPSKDSMSFGTPNVLPSPGAMPQGVTPGVNLTGDGAIAPIHTEFQGLPIHIETHKGETRASRDPGRPWTATMAANYGFIVGTGSAEGPDEGMDCFVGPDCDAEHVYMINQGKHDNPKAFDEVKVMLGFRSRWHAYDTYRSSYDSPAAAEARIMQIKECTMYELKEWLKGDHTFPFPG